MSSAGYAQINRGRINNANRERNPSIPRGNPKRISQTQEANHLTRTVKDGQVRDKELFAFEPIHNSRILLFHISRELIVAYKQSEHVARLPNQQHNQSEAKIQPFRLIEKKRNQRAHQASRIKAFLMPATYRLYKGQKSFISHRSNHTAAGTQTPTKVVREALRVFKPQRDEDRIAELRDDIQVVFTAIENGEFDYSMRQLRMSCSPVSKPEAGQGNEPLSRTLHRRRRMSLRHNLP